MSEKQTIHIYLPTGDPSGIRIAFLPVWTVQVFDVPRPQLADFLKRPEAGQVGVYYLLDEDDSPSCYIGQSGSIGTRLKDHASTSAKDFWTRALVAVSRTKDWTTTHATFLERESIALVRQADRYRMMNSNSGSQPYIPESLQSECEEYLSIIRLLVSTLGYRVLEKPRKPSSEKIISGMKPEPAEGVRVSLREGSAQAEGVYSSEGLLVLTGSRGKFKDTVYPTDKYILTRINKLAAEGVIEIKGQDSVFTRDHLFRSPSGAATTLLCYASNGRTAWKTSSGQTIAEMEEAEIAETE